MKFLLVASFPDSILRFRGALLDVLLARGLDVHVAAPGLKGGSEWHAELTSRGIKTHNITLRRTGLNPAADLLTLFQLWRLMRLIRPEILLAYTIKPVIYGTWAALIAQVPRRFALITGLGYAFQGSPKQRTLLRKLVERLYGFALRGVSKVFFQNPDDEALFRELGLVPAMRPSVVVNGSGIDVALYRVALLPVSLRFLLIARLLGDKGVREYAQAARIVREFHPDVRFQLVGWIDENPDSIGQSELDAWASEGSVEFLGRLDDVRPAIADCTVYVLPSYREGTPRTVLEAMSMGRPVITTNAPGCRETVVDGDNGFLVPVKSVSALVAAMLRFVDDAALAPRMGVRSRQVAEEKYDVHKVNEVMLHEMGITAICEAKVAKHG